MYFDNAATTFPKPDCVGNAVFRYIRELGAAAGRGAYGAAEKSDRILTSCRHRVATLLDIERPDNAAFTFNCTDSLNLVLNGLLNDGDRVVTTMLEHNSVLRPLEVLRNHNRASVEHVPFDSNTGLVDLNLLDIALSKAETRLVVINHASNVTGVVQPVKKVSEIARRNGALVLLDAAQTAGHLPFSIQDLDVDFAATAGHKGLLGPLGTGVLYIRSGLENELRPTRSGGTGTSSESLLQPEEMPGKFESGNANMPGIAGLNAALEWIINEGVEKLYERAHRLIIRLREGLMELSGVAVCCPEAHDVVGVVSLSIDGLDCREAATILDQSFDIQCRSGFHCAPLAHQVLGSADSGGTLRLSPGPFTSEADVEHVIQSVAELAAAMR